MTNGSLARRCGCLEPLLRASHPSRRQLAEPPPGQNFRCQFTRLVGSTQEPSEQGSYVPFIREASPLHVFSAAAILPGKEEWIDVGAIDAAVLIDIG